MHVIGITGGSGSGKSCICNALKKFGYVIIDADSISREIVAPGSVVLAQIVAAFGEDVLLNDGQLNRKALADIVFNSKEKLEILNRIMHEHIRQEIESRLSDKSANYIIDAPLLYKARLDRLCDYVIGIDAERDVRLARIMRRDGLTTDEATSRLNSQTDVDETLSKVDYCIDTTFSNFPDEYAAQIDEYIRGVTHDSN